MNVEPKKLVVLNRGTTEGADCPTCPFSRNGEPNKPVVSEYPDKPAWLVVGEGPGRLEVQLGKPFCLVPETLVLMADLRWKPLGDVVVGDKIISINEHSNPGKGASRASARRWLIAEVLATHRRIARAFDVETTQGHLIGSADHPVLTRQGGNRAYIEKPTSSGKAIWKTIGELWATQSHPDHIWRNSKIVFFGWPWEQRLDYNAAWLAGFFDGEGHVLGSRPDRRRSVRTKKRSKDAQVGFSQNAGPTYERAKAAIEAIGYQLNTKHHNRHKGVICNRATIAGGLYESMRFLGQVRPERLIDYYAVALEGKSMRGIDAARVLSRTAVGDRELVDITTTSGTFIANGFVVHNCGPSGQEVNKILHKIGRPRDELGVLNVTLCLPPYGSPVEDRERAASACRGRLQRELASWPGIPILTLGAVAARTVIPKATLDAIDPLDVPKSKKRGQKDRQKADNKAAKKQLEKINKDARKLSHAAIKHHLSSLVRELKRKHGRAPDQRYLNQEEYRVRAQIWKKCLKDAEASYEQKVEERRLAKIAKAITKPRKKKPVKITDIMSTAFTVDVDGSGPRVVIPAIHPAALLRGGGATIGGTHSPDLAFVNLTYDAAKVNSIAQGKDIWLRFPIEIEVFDVAKATSLFLQIFWEAIEAGEVAIDLETYVDDPDRHTALMAYAAKVRVLGLATKTRTIAVAWDLLPAWCQSYLQVLLTRVTVIAQNGLYDRTVLRAYGVILNEIWEDTLIQHASAFPGCAHRLQQITSQLFAVEPWKCLQADTAVLLPDRSTISIRQAVQQRIPEVLSLENGQIVPKKVLGWHEVYAPDQAWVSIKTERSDAKYNRGLVVTPDHKVMTQRGLVEAQALIVGQDRIAIDEPAFSADQISTAVGTLLGDSSIFVSRSYHHRSWEASRASLRGGHANEGLRDCKAESLALGTSGQRVLAHSRVSKGITINASDFYAYGTTWAFQYMQVAALVYDKNWKRRIKSEALAVLGKRGLAMMYMDDGDLHKTKQTIGAGFATNGFPLEDVELFARWLRGRYGAVSIYNTHGPYVAMSTVATKNMLEDLRGFIHPSVGYKTIFDDPFKPVAKGRGVYHAEIRAIDSVDRAALRKGRSSYSTDYRYCLSVEDTKLFYTNYGLVSNSEYRNQEETPEKLAIYCAKDTFATIKDHHALQILVKRTKTERVYARDLKMSEIASKMHLDGMPVSREINSELITQFSKLAIEARRVVEERVRDPKTKDAIKHHLALGQALKKRKADPEDFEARYHARKVELEHGWKWKIGASDHIVALLQAIGVQLTQTTAKGKVSTKKEILEGLVDVEVVRDILTYRENEKMLSTFLLPIFDQNDIHGQILSYGFADENDRVHPIWSLPKISGRWASKDPVESNPPKEKGKGIPKGMIISLTEAMERGFLKRPTTKRQIVPKRGRVLVGFDFAQLEARIIALISGDPFLLWVFSTGQDIHTECAKVIFDGQKDRNGKASLSWDELGDGSGKRTSAQTACRNVTKNVEYGSFYGGSDETLWKTLLKEGFNVTLADVALSVRKLNAKMAGVVAWQRATIQAASTYPFTLRDYVDGRMRVWPMGQVDPSEALNIVPQATGAAIMNTGMERMSYRTPKYKQCFPIVQIHDAAAYECWEDDAEAVLADINECFPQEYERNGVVVPFPIEGKIGRSLAEV